MPIRLNPTFSGGQRNSDVAALANRNFAVVWHDVGLNSGDIKLQLFSPVDGAVGSERIVNVGLTGNQSTPAVAALSNGGFVVTWEDLPGSGSVTSIKYRVYNSSGQPVTGELTAAPGPEDQRYPAIAGGSNGSFAITWANGASGEHVGRLFNALGQPTSGATPTTIGPARGTLDGAVAIDGNSFAFIYEDINNNATGDGIYLRQTTGFPTGSGVAARIDPGTTLGQPIPNSTEGHSTPDIAFGGPTGTSLASVWSNQFGIGAARQNDIVLNFNGATSIINTTTFGDQFAPAIATLPNGGFLVVWNHTVTGTQNPAGSIQEIRGQEISPTGTLVGGELNFSNNGTSGTTFLPRLAVNGDGVVLLTWSQAGPTTSGEDILGEFLQHTVTPTLPSTNQNDTIPGTAGPDVIDAAAGNDRIDPGGGNDTVGGGPGIDTTIFNGPRGNATLTINLVLTILADLAGSANGTDLLTNVERIRFSDGTLALDIALPGQGSSNAGSAYRLYEAAFNRTPDAPGLAFWINQLDQGMSVRQAAQGFVGSAEFQARYGVDPSASQLVSSFYQNILDRPAEQAGFDFWFGILNNRPDQRATVLEGIANSAENQDGLIGIIGQGIFLPGALLV